MCNEVKYLKKISYGEGFWQKGFSWKRFKSTSNIFTINKYISTETVGSYEIFLSVKIFSVCTIPAEILERLGEHL